MSARLSAASLRQRQNKTARQIRSTARFQLPPPITNHFSPSFSRFPRANGRTRRGELLTSTPTYIASAHQWPPLPPNHDRFGIAESRCASLDPECHQSAHNSTPVAPAPVARPPSHRPAQLGRRRRSGRRKAGGCNRDHTRRRDTTTRYSNTNNRHRNGRGGNCCAATNRGCDVPANSSVAPHYTRTHFRCV